MSAPIAHTTRPAPPPVLSRLAVGGRSALAAIRELHEQNDFARRLAQTLVGKQVAIVGRHVLSRAQLVERIERCGASVLPRFDDGTDALVVGAEPPVNDLARAAKEGVLVLGADDLEHIARARQAALGRTSRAFQLAVETARQEATRGRRPAPWQAPQERRETTHEERMARRVEELARMRTRDMIR